MIIAMITMVGRNRLRQAEVADRPPGLSVRGDELSGSNNSMTIDRREVAAALR